MNNEVFTIKEETKALYKEKGSKFYSFAFPIKTESQIIEILNKLKSDHSHARHFCYAWCLGFDRQKFKINDDGEPNGTAGKPIFNQILSNNLSNILLVVVRYFGGTLLGKSGLINAYKTATKDAIEIAEKILIVEQIILLIQLDFLQLNNIMKLIKSTNATIINQQINQEVIIKVVLPKKEWQKIENKFSTICKIEIIEE